MSAVLLAVFNDYETADRVRLELFRDGFPTDRVDLTAVCDLGRAACEPADQPLGKFIQYFGTLFKSDADRHYVATLAGRIDGGAAAVTVHPRGLVETRQAARIIDAGRPAEVAHRDLENQTLERAAASSDQPWIKHVMLEKSEAHCIYCRLFESTHHAH